ncbi:Pimeloyl-ACP methyl ester carboxylesterase [Rhizobiales bacterium GAS188]|nr:Pimeloyl-ACP methyl ester carboxylesterase [Rhizobiales bacterium GAS188]
MLLLHGFPGSSSDWRHQIPALLATGYRVVAPDLLGLGRSAKPPELEPYMAAREIERMLELVTRLGVATMMVVGHDRGAGVAWGLAALHPERVEKLVALTVGHPNTARDISVEQREKSWYMLLFQLDGAETLLRQDDWRLFRDLLRHHPGTPEWLSHLAPEGALSAALNWYRANRHPAAPPRPLLPDVTVPAFGLYTLGDHYLLPAYMLESHRFVRRRWRCERVDGVSHFMMLDRPAEVTRLILDFLAEGGS